MKTPISVVICSHNPRRDYLQRTLAALQAQTLSKDQWELLLVDNASAQPLSPQYDLTWHPAGRHIREEELGLTPARLRGICESSGELLVFVDDDNVLAEDYLEVAANLASANPHIGAFGGSIKGEFETPPPEWILPYLPALAVSEINQDYWSNIPRGSEAVPCGAGLCVKRGVAVDYLQKARADSRRRALDRTGAGMGGGGDTDLAFCATDIGLGMARYCGLRMGHLIPSGRLTEEYVVRLQAGFAATAVLLWEVRDNRRVRYWDESRGRVCWAWHLLRADRLRRRIMLQSRKAQADAWAFLNSATGDKRRVQP